MAKKRVRPALPPTATAAESGAPTRLGGHAATQAKIARIDGQLARLVQQRASLVLKTGSERDPSVLTAVASGLEDESLARAIGQCPGPLSEATLRAVFREIQSGCRSLVRELRIAFLGPSYTYSHLAALRRFGQAVEYVPVGTIQAVFEEVDRGHSDFGVVPVENSTDGRIADTLDMFTRLPVRICGEVEMEIHHALLGKCPRTEVREVYSRPQALSQCRNWLAKHLPSARAVEVTSTSTAAQLAQEKSGAAAIASSEAGVHYGLDLLAERIEDNAGNTTRFVILGSESSERTGTDRTALLFQLEHRPGSLAEALNIFKRNRVNLTWLESFPIPESNRAYLFFVEMEGHQTDLRVRRALAALKRKALRLEILGSFPVTRTEQ